MRAIDHHKDRIERHAANTLYAHIHALLNIGEHDHPASLRRYPGDEGMIVLQIADDNRTIRADRSGIIGSKALGNLNTCSGQPFLDTLHAACRSPAKSPIYEVVCCSRLTNDNAAVGRSRKGFRTATKRTQVGHCSVGPTKSALKALLIIHCITDNDLPIGRNTIRIGRVRSAQRFEIRHASAHPAESMRVQSVKL